MFYVWIWRGIFDLNLRDFLNKFQFESLQIGIDAPFEGVGWRLVDWIRHHVDCLFPLGHSNLGVSKILTGFRESPENFGSTWWIRAEATVYQDPGNSKSFGQFIKKSNVFLPEFGWSYRRIDHFWIRCVSAQTN
jgi:hypothetical protein